jgi:flagellar biosynthesis chaperone FliJ
MMSEEFDKHQYKMFCKAFIQVINDYKSKIDKQAEQIKQLEQDLKEAKAELIKRNKQLGVACLEHDLVHSLCCGHCLEQAEKQRDKLAELVSTAYDAGVSIHHKWHEIQQQLQAILKGGE